MKYEIEESIVQSLLNYLASRPYSEVYQGITALGNLKPIKDEEVKEIKTNKGE